MFIITGCQNERLSLQKEIKKLEKQMEKSPSDVIASNLIRQYMLYNASYPQDQENASRYLYRMAALQVRQYKSDQAASTLNEALTRYYNSSNTVNNALLLAAVSKDNLSDEQSATTIYQALHRAFPNDKKVREKIEALPAGTGSLENRLEKMHAEVFSDTTGRINNRTARFFIYSCELATLINPSDPQNPNWLHQAAETARAAKANNKAMALYEKIYIQYPDYEKAPQTLFLHAFILDTELRQFEEAKTLYQKFLEQYPNDEFADDATFLLENLGKDENEIIDSFQNKESE